MWRKIDLVGGVNVVTVNMVDEFVLRYCECDSRNGRTYDFSEWQDSDEFVTSDFAEAVDHGIAWRSYMAFYLDSPCSGISRSFLKLLRGGGAIFGLLGNHDALEKVGSEFLRHINASTFLIAPDCPPCFSYAEFERDACDISLIESDFFRETIRRHATV